MDIFLVKDYREILRMMLKGDQSKRPRGVINRYALALNCHSSLIAHILSGKAHMTCEQGIRTCQFFNFTELETEFYINLILMERAGDLETKHFFEQKLLQIIESRNNMTKRWKVNSAFTHEQELIYYDSWIPMATHLAVHLKTVWTEEGVAQLLRVPIEIANETVKNLISIGVIEKIENKLRPTEISFHLGKNSKAANRAHINLRQKAIQELHLNHKAVGHHYSSFISLSQKDAEELREIVIKQIEQIRERVKTSTPEELYLHNVDFIKVSR